MTLLDYAEAYLELGEARFRLRCGGAFLVQTVENDEDTSLNFKTSFMARSALGSARIDEPASDSTPVWKVAKRTGGAFADRIGVGRTRNADVWLPSQKVSKYHAFFTELEDGSLQLTDAGSRNGTFVQGRRLPERETVEVPFGSEVAFGPCRFVLHSPESFLKLVAEEARRARR